MMTSDGTKQDNFLKFQETLHRDSVPVRRVVSDRDFFEINKKLLYLCKYNIPETK